jgi:hypothetical protein
MPLDSTHSDRVPPEPVPDKGYGKEKRPDQEKAAKDVVEQEADIELAIDDDPARGTEYGTQHAADQEREPDIPLARRSHGSGLVFQSAGLPAQRAAPVSVPLDASPG